MKCFVFNSQNRFIAFKFWRKIDFFLFKSFLMQLVSAWECGLIIWGMSRKKNQLSNTFFCGFRKMYLKTNLPGYSIVIMALNGFLKRKQLSLQHSNQWWSWPQFFSTNGSKCYSVFVLWAVVSSLTVSIYGSVQSFVSSHNPLFSQWISLIINHLSSLSCDVCSIVSKCAWASGSVS